MSSIVCTHKMSSNFSTFFKTRRFLFLMIVPSQEHIPCFIYIIKELKNSYYIMYNIYVYMSLVMRLLSELPKPVWFWQISWTCLRVTLNQTWHLGESLQGRVVVPTHLYDNEKWAVYHCHAMSLIRAKKRSIRQREYVMLKESVKAQSQCQRILIRVNTHRIHLLFLQPTVKIYNWLN